MQAGQVVHLVFRPPPPDAPSPIYRPFLAYPRGAYAARQEGTVVVGYDILPFGRTGNVHVISASLPGIFDEAAARYVGSLINDRTQLGATASAQTIDVVLN